MSEATAEEEYELDPETKVIWGIGGALISLLFPWKDLDPDAPLDRQLWRWRYTYLLFIATTLLITSQGILQGDYWLVPIVIAPHVLAPPFLAWAYFFGPLTGIGIPMVSVPDWWLLAGVVAVSWTAVGLETLRRIAPWIPIFSVPNFFRWDDQFVTPMSRYDERSPSAPYLPQLDIGVSTLVLGETGSGKTEALRVLAYQLPYDSGTAVIAHDYKQDFQQFYEDLGFDVVRISVEDSDAIWNLFADVEKERQFRELSETVFGKQQGNDPFHGPAKQVFEAILTYLDREGNGNDVSHKDLVEFLQLDRTTMQRRLEEHQDLARYAQHLDSETGKSAMNVYQEIQEYTGRVFVGDFAEEGSFSLRDYIDNPDGRVVIIDSKPSEMDTLGPMFRLLTDWSIRFAMESETDVNFILDEVDRLPALNKLPAVTSAGRSENTRALVGVQTVGQLRSRYDTKTEGILGNCPQGLYFSPGEAETIEHIQSEVGIERQTVGSKTVRNTGEEKQRSKSMTVQETDRHPIPSAQLKRFDTGDCIVKDRTNWWMGRLYTLEDIKPRLDVDPSRSTSEMQEIEPEETVLHTDQTADSSLSGDEDVETAAGPDDTSSGDTSTADAEIDETTLEEADRETASAASTSHSAGDSVDENSETDRDVSDIVDTDDSPDQVEEPAHTEQSESGSESDVECIDEDEPDEEEQSEPIPEYSVEDQMPRDLVDLIQWLTWKPKDGRKIPRAPWLSERPDKWVSAVDPDIWTSFEKAKNAAERYDGHKVAFTIRDRDDYPNEVIVLVDYDDVRDPETGAIHKTVREHIQAADSYAQVSTSGTGVHILCQGELPEGVKTIDAALPEDPDFPDGEIEVYDSSHYIAMTGDHIVGTPEETRDCQSFLDELANTFATVPDSAPDEIAKDPETSREEIADIETTTDIQDVLDAVQHTKPRDIRLKSTVTEERSDGSKSLDPSWADSQSGTRLAQVDDGWIYRKGMHGLDALQVVALEERIISHPDEYPKGNDFWAAIKALRQRGAHIPLFPPKESPTDQNQSSSES